MTGLLATLLTSSLTSSSSDDEISTRLSPLERSLLEVVVDTEEQLSVSSESKVAEIRSRLETTKPEAEDIDQLRTVLD